MTVIHELDTSLTTHNRGPVRLVAISENEIGFLQRMLQHAVEAGASLTDAKAYIKLNESLRLRFAFAEKLDADVIQHGEQAYAQAKEKEVDQESAAWAQKFEESYWRGHAYGAVLQMTDADIESTLIFRYQNQPVMISTVGGATVNNPSSAR